MIINSQSFLLGFKVKVCKKLKMTQLLLSKKVFYYSSENLLFFESFGLKKLCLSFSKFLFFNS